MIVNYNIGSGQIICDDWGAAGQKATKMQWSMAWRVWFSSWNCWPSVLTMWNAHIVCPSWSSICRPRPEDWLVLLTPPCLFLPRLNDSSLEQRGLRICSLRTQIRRNFRIGFACHKNKDVHVRKWYLQKYGA